MSYDETKYSKIVIVKLTLLYVQSLNINLYQVGDNEIIAPIQYLYKTFLRYKWQSSYHTISLAGEAT